MRGMPHPLDKAHVLLTGATGFVGQAVLERLLSGHPDAHITLLVRPRGDITAAQRVAKLLRKPVFRPWREAVGKEGAEAALQDRISVIEGDLGAVPALPGDLDVVIHSASTVSFDLPIDEAFVANVAGPASLYEALQATGGDPHVVHVSTAYVAGARKGVAEERSLDHEIDHLRELDSAVAARAAAENDSRTPSVLGGLNEKAEAEHRRAGPRAVAAATEALRQEWVTDRLVDAGRIRAQSLGWPDVYTFTKAMGERVAEGMWAGAGHRLSVLRPTIIESALRHPFPGWIDGFKVADPLIAAYGRGMLPEFPALADTVLDIIPVDFVVNATLEAAATAPPAEEPAYYQVSSSVTNPLRIGQLVSTVREYFSENPLTDHDGSRVSVPAWSFPHPRAVERALRRRESAVSVADKALSRLPATARTRGWIKGLDRTRKDLVRLRKFTSLYQPYTQTEVTFDDARVRELHFALADADRGDRGFDVADIDWRHYLQSVHIPNVPGLLRQSGGPSKAPGPAALPERTDVLAVFDLQRTLASATLVEQYLWVELAAHPPSRWPRSLAGLVASAPRFLQAERRDRADFIRTFMRRYAGVDPEVLREVIAREVTPSMRRDVFVDAMKRVQAHRAAGHRTVLVSGEIDVFVEPFAPLFDDVVAGSMEVGEDGRWTGHLETSPLVGEARAAWLRRYAREHDMDLEGSFAYGDAYADRPWLDVVGNPHAVNPDASLYRYAHARRWPVLTWTETAESRVVPVLRSLRGGS